MPLAGSSVRARQAGEASSTGGSRPRKTPRPHAVAGGLPGQPAHRSLAPELPGTGLAWRQQLLLCPFAKSQGDKTEPSFKRDTQWSLHRALQQSGPAQTGVLTQEGGLEKQKVQYPSLARMLGLERMKSNATGVQQALS